MICGRIALSKYSSFYNNSRAILVYAGLAILNPSAKAQVRQYSLSVAALFKLMIQEKEAEFVARIRAVMSNSHKSWRRECFL